MIDIRGNEEATWQELDRGDAKRTQFGRFHETLLHHAESRHITSCVMSRRIALRCVALRHITLHCVTPRRVS